MKLQNTLGRRLVDFSPLEPGHVRLYTCGPTVYNVVHIGNLRTFLFEDVLRRHFRAGGHRVTHISGTPSHWRRALMSPSAHRISPEYVRLSGEIADQAILDHLRAFYPAARITHAFASTEAGVAFAVGDGLAGFPASLVGQRDAAVELRVEGGTLRIRSARRHRARSAGCT